MLERSYFRLKIYLLLKKLIPFPFKRILEDERRNTSVYKVIFFFVSYS